MDKQSLIQTRLWNNKVAWIVSDFTNDTSNVISEELIKEIDPSNSLPKEALFKAIFSELIEFDDEKQKNYFTEHYLDKCITELDAAVYRANPYYRNIALPKVSRGGWEFTRLEYKPYEAFISNDIIFDPLTLKEIPQVGFFTERFSYPAVLQDSREWMAIKPSEIESMQPAINKISGKVVTFGLGLGYFAYMASRKPDVTKVTIVERDKDVIALFKEYILPQFSQAKKIEIIQCDAFDYMESTLPKEDFDFAFVDLWHDTSDGATLYKKSKGYEKLSPNTEFLYWVEESLISAYRWEVFEEIVDSSPTAQDAILLLYSKKLADDLRK